MKKKVAYNRLPKDDEEMNIVEYLFGIKFIKRQTNTITIVRKTKNQIFCLENKKRIEIIFENDYIFLFSVHFFLVDLIIIYKFQFYFHR